MVVLTLMILVALPHVPYYVTAIKQIGLKNLLDL
jgi:hypothetical protein